MKKLESDKKDMERQLLEAQQKLKSILDGQQESADQTKAKHAAELKQMKEQAKEYKHKLLEQLAPPKW